MKVGSLEIELLANMARLQKDMDQAKRTVDGAMRSIQKSVDIAAAAFGGLASGLSVGAFTALIRSSADAMDKIDEMSQRMSISTKTLQELEYVGKMTGVSIDSLAGGMKNLQVNMLESITGSKEQEAIFRAIGVAVKDASGNMRASEDVMADVADVFADMEGGATKTALAVKLFGKSGQELIPFLNEGKSGIKGLTDEAHNLGAVMDEEAIKAAAEFNDQLDKLSTVSAAAANSVTGALLPAVNDLIQRFLEGKKAGMDFWQAASAAANITIDRAKGQSYAEQLKTVNEQLEYQRKIIGDQRKNLPSWMAPDDSEIKRLEQYKKALQEMQARQALMGNEASEYEDEKQRRMAAGSLNSSAIAQALKDGKAEKEKLSEYERLIRSIKEKIAAEQAEFSSLEKLTEGERLQAKIMADLEGGVLKLTESERGYVRVLLDQLVAEEKSNEAKQLAAKANQEAADAKLKFIVSLTDELEKVKENVREQEMHNAQLGLSKEAIAALEAAKLEEQAATIDGIAIKKLDRDLDEYQYGLYKQQAEELRKLAKLKREGADKEVAIEEQKKIAEEPKKVWGNFTENVQRNLGDNLYNAMRGNFDNIGDAFLSMLQRMVADALAADLMNAILPGSRSGGMNGLLGAIGRGLGGMFGGGADAYTSNLPSSSGMEAWAASFDGGGYTGGGQRSGGIDGKGGFPAILHPQETVIDHTKGGTVGGNQVSISVQVDANGSNAEGSDAQAKELGNMIGNAVRGVLVQEMRPGGLLAA